MNCRVCTVCTVHSTSLRYYICFLCNFLKVQYIPNRRRIQTEELARVVAAALGTEFTQFLSANFAMDNFEEDELHQEVKKNRINLSISLNRPGAKILEWQGIISFFLSQTTATT